MIVRLQVMINLFIMKQRKTSLAPRKNPRIRIFITNARSDRLLLLSEIEVEGDIQPQFPGEIFGKKPTACWEPTSTDSPCLDDSRR